MKKLTRFCLSLKPQPRVHVPAGARPSLMLARNGEDWLIAMSHGGQEIARYTPKEARLEANRFLRMAWLATHPGECPQGVLE